MPVIASPALVKKSFEEAILFTLQYSHRHVITKIWIIYRWAFLLFNKFRCACTIPHIPTPYIQTVQSNELKLVIFHRTIPIPQPACATSNASTGLHNTCRLYGARGAHMCARAFREPRALNFLVVDDFDKSTCLRGVARASARAPGPSSPLLSPFFTHTAVLFRFPVRLLQQRSSGPRCFVPRCTSFRYVGASSARASLLWLPACSLWPAEPRRPSDTAPHKHQRMGCARPSFTIYFFLECVLGLSFLRGDSCVYSVRFETRLSPIHGIFMDSELAGGVFVIMIH